MDDNLKRMLRMSIQETLKNPAIDAGAPKTFSVAFPEGLYDCLKLVTVMDGSQMKDVLVEAVKKYLRDYCERGGM